MVIGSNSAERLIILASGLKVQIGKSIAAFGLRVPAAVYVLFLKLLVPPRSTTPAAALHMGNS